MGDGERRNMDIGRHLHLLRSFAPLTQLIPSRLPLARALSLPPTGTPQTHFFGAAPPAAPTQPFCIVSRCSCSVVLPSLSSAGTATCRWSGFRSLSSTILHPHCNGLRRGQYLSVFLLSSLWFSGALSFSMAGKRRLNHAPFSPYTKKFNQWKEPAIQLSAPWSAFRLSQVTFVATRTPPGHKSLARWRTVAQVPPKVQRACFCCAHTPRATHRPR